MTSRTILAVSLLALAACATTQPTYSRAGDAKDIDDYLAAK